MNTLARALAILGGLKRNWRRPEALLLLMGLVMPIAFSTWLALLNNFAIERAAFTGVEIGILQSLREVPGFLAFTVVFALLLVREQTLGLLSLCLLGLGVAITGYFPTVVGLYLTTVAMSIGFHYHEAIRQSLALQWLDKDKAPAFFGNMIAVGAFASLITYGAIYLGLDLAGMDMTWIYAIGGGLALALAIFGWVVFPRFPQKVEQRKHLVLRRRYWLYYALIFMQGARRQIFVVFAGFLMVEKFGFDAAAISLMFLFNTGVNIFLAPFVGHLIARWGERRALTVEYVGLIAVFSPTPSSSWPGSGSPSTSSTTPSSPSTSPSAPISRRSPTRRTSPRPPASASPSTTSRRWCCRWPTASCGWCRRRRCS